MEELSRLTDEELIDLYEEAWTERLQATEAAPMTDVENADLRGLDLLYAEIERRGLEDELYNRDLTPPGED